MFNDPFGVWSRAPPLLSSRFALPIGQPSFVVAIPVKDEEERLPACLRALARQRDRSGRPIPPALISIVAFANNCTDRSASLASAVFLAFRPGEDKALIDFAFASRCQEFDYCPSVQVITSGRTNGRAPGGVADTLRIRSTDPEASCDEALMPFRAAFTRALWRGRRLRRLHGAGRLGLDDEWGRTLGFSARDVDEIGKAWAFGAAWSAIEGRSPFFARRLLRPAELPEQISIARRSLARLRKVGSRVRQHIQAEARVPI